MKKLRTRFGVGLAAAASLSGAAEMRERLREPPKGFVAWAREGEVSAKAVSAPNLSDLLPLFTGSTDAGPGG